MTRLEKILMALTVVIALDIVVRVAPQHRTASGGDQLSFVEAARAQVPIIGVSLLPRYVITTNQSGDVLYVWEDQGKGYEPKFYAARR